MDNKRNTKAKQSPKSDSGSGSKRVKKARHGYYLRSKTFHKPYSGRKAVLAMEMTIKGTTCIDGCVWISATTILVTERDRKTMALIDVDRKKVTTRVECLSSPRNVEKIDKSCVGITFPNEKMIRIMKIEGASISCDREIPVSDECYGLAYDSISQIFFVTLYTSGDIARYKLDGSPLAHLRLSEEIKSEVRNAYCLAYSETFRHVFISCYFKSKVIAVDIDGNVVSEHECIKSPWQVEFDLEDNLYICCYGSNSLKQINMSGEGQPDIVSVLDDISEPKVMVWNDDMDFFAIATNKSIRKYKFE